MGQALQKLGREEKKDIGPIIESCYEKYFEGQPDPNMEWDSAKFYHAVSQTIEDINKELGSTQLRVPKIETLEQAYNNHQKGKGKSLTKEEFQRILQEVILKTGVSGMGMRDIFLYIFGIPLVAVFIKQRTVPNSIPNDVFIPGVTSATVYLLAKLNKI